MSSLLIGGNVIMLWPGWVMFVTTAHSGGMNLSLTLYGRMRNGVYTASDPITPEVEITPTPRVQLPPFTGTSSIVDSSSFELVVREAETGRVVHRETGSNGNWRHGTYSQRMSRWLGDSITLPPGKYNMQAILYADPPYGDGRDGNTNPPTVSLGWATFRLSASTSNRVYFTVR